jgi:hypothetical protein
VDESGEVGGDLGGDDVRSGRVGGREVQQPLDACIVDQCREVRVHRSDLRQPAGDRLRVGDVHDDDGHPVVPGCHRLQPSPVPARDDHARPAGVEARRKARPDAGAAAGDEDDVVL